MNVSESILRSVIMNATRDSGPNDDFAAGWYRGMITAAQHDETIDPALVRRANQCVDAFRARRGAQPEVPA
jgi:hypothetical protein